MATQDQFGFDSCKKEAIAGRISGRLVASDMNCNLFPTGIDIYHRTGVNHFYPTSDVDNNKLNN